MKTTNKQDAPLWPSQDTHRAAVIALLETGWFFNHVTGEWSNDDATITGRLEWDDKGNAWIRRPAPPYDATTPFNLPRIQQRITVLKGDL